MNVPPSFPPDPLVGTSVREYAIVSKIGEGGMGAVYKAYHNILKQYRALKVLRHELVGDESFIARFLREAQTLTELNHTNVARFFEFFRQEDGTLFMAMEYVEGERLDVRIQAKGRLSEGEILPIIRQVCLGIEETHSRGIIHRDISPDNIMIVRTDSGRERVKILDFGIAKNPADPDKTSQITQVGTFVGKYRYCSPEQAQAGDEDLLDPRSDIYSLGVLLYHAVTGAFPFDAQTSQTYLVKQMTEEVVPLRARVPDIPCSAELEALILRMLARDREDRPRTIRDVLKGLDEIEARARKRWDFPGLSDFPEQHTEELAVLPLQPPLAEPAGGPSAVRKGTMVLGPLAQISARWRLLALACALCLLAAGAALLTRHILQAPPEPAAISVVSIPSGAHIYIDGVLQEGKTPHTIRDVTARRTHTLRVEKEGYAPWSTEFNLEGGAVRVFTANLREP